MQFDVTKPTDPSYFSKLQDLCTCDPPLTGDRYTTCADEHEEACEYRRALPMIREMTRDEGHTRG